MQSLTSIHFPVANTRQQESHEFITDSTGAVVALFVTLYGGSDSDNLLQSYYDDVTGGLILLEVRSFFSLFLFPLLSTLSLKHCCFANATLYRAVF